MSKKFKNEKYKGVRIGFVETHYNGWKQPRDKFGNHLPAVRNPKMVTAVTDKGYGEVSGFTKKEAFEFMKNQIDRINRVNKRLNKGYPSGTEKIMANEW